MPTLSTSRASRRSWLTLSNCTIPKKTLFLSGNKEVRGSASAGSEETKPSSWVHGGASEFAMIKDGVYEIYPWLSDSLILQ